MKNLLLFLIFATNALAIPQLINYQGQLTSPSGTPLDTTVSMTFRVYPVVSGGIASWTETHPSVVVTDGLFQVSLGSVTTLTDQFVADRWLGITIGNNTEMSPRQQVTSVAHAYRVGTVDGASGGTISGKLNVGTGNTNSGIFSNVIGQSNSVLANNSSICGGYFNVVNQTVSVIGGGAENEAQLAASVIGGGIQNVSNGHYSVIGGGEQNSAIGDHSTITGGLMNSTSDDFATVCGGGGNHAANGSFACGVQARANHPFSFVFGSLSIDSTRSFSDYSFTARCPGGARFYTSAVNITAGVELPGGGGAWNSLCDVNQKNIHGSVDSRSILEKVSSLPLYRWSYKTQDESVQHIGPTAQDFHAAFGLGDNNTTISTIDPDGVALAAVKELAIQNSEKDKKIEDLEARIEQLEAAILQFGNLNNSDKQ